jgi:hypothetical protein
MSLHTTPTALELFRLRLGRSRRKRETVVVRGPLRVRADSGLSGHGPHQKGVAAGPTVQTPPFYGQSTTRVVA